mmetsp:Transcript_22672/g.40814  ORF Transcript_22672/g.40814 Transcript_22672/m.40814 type:complete len:210 (+) Transcript_22672:1466-2095(+)|eukprot:CAMPEP_0204910084 /NCGR_PEP_ID=MMETSP1397-20131031/8669_1 /ASSEMBLY_ACC=CAM_ASM_000891 /TAXON_ID=49980 /ORGANISM="Climacostomum Climacostomum virens, Strain Stock W-24" /LENGTH=209 /DNA_ID=CAMNT_0052080111 /DNA_START=219 /DNA_END=848 /DNA_ORIENTATION=-
MMEHDELKQLKPCRSANILLAKDDVGKSKPPARDLPPFGFTYGKSAGQDPEGATQVLTSWRAHINSPPRAGPKDFAKLNLMSVSEGLHTAKQAKHFRSMHDLRIQPDPAGKLYKTSTKPPEHLVFGMPCRPGTPMYEVMSNYYGRCAPETLHSVMTPPKATKSPHLPRMTKASQYLATAVKLSFSPTSPSAFKLKKFTRVAPRTSSHRQ